MTAIAIPDDVLNSMKIPRSDQERVLKMELALTLYERGILTMGKARKLARISKREFLEELGKREIERHYAIEELEEDLAFAKGDQRSPTTIFFVTEDAEAATKCDRYPIDLQASSVPYRSCQSRHRSL